MAALIIFGVVFITEAERPIPITYAKRVRGMKVYGGISTYLPLRVNQAGVIPIIFALSILLLPQMALNFLATINNATVKAISDFYFEHFKQPVVLCRRLFHFGFSIHLLLHGGNFWPRFHFPPTCKIRRFHSWRSTGQTNIGTHCHVLTRITLVGALFLGVIAVLPLVMQSITGMTSLAHRRYRSAHRRFSGHWPSQKNRGASFDEEY